MRTYNDKQILINVSETTFEMLNNLILNITYLSEKHMSQ